MIRASADWRFLETVPHGGRALVTGDVAPELESLFNVTFAGVATPEVVGPFELIVFHGVPRTRDLSIAREILDPATGVIVVGIGDPEFDSAVGMPASPRVGLVAMRARRGRLVVDSVYAALPNPWNPEYLFPPEKTGTHFAVTRYLRSRRPSGRLTRWAADRRWWWPLAALGSPGAMVLLRLEGRRG